MTIILYVVAVVVVVADQVIKYLISSNMAYGERIPVISGFFDLVNWRNTGAAWGIFSDRTELLSIFTGLACLVLLYLLAATKPKLFAVSLSLILGGAVGNLIDRVRLGYVVDYLRFYWKEYEFPAFNLADSCIVVGCGFLVIFLLFIQKEGTELLKPNCLVRKLGRRVTSKSVSAAMSGETDGGEDVNEMPVSTETTVEEDAHV